MTDLKSPDIDTGGQGTFSRRDFLKLSALTVGALATSSWWGESDPSKLPNWDQVDFATSPDELIKHPELREKMYTDLHEWGKLVDDTWKVQQRIDKTEEKGYVNFEEWDKNTHKLVDEVSDLSKLLSDCEQGKISGLALDELRIKYFEYASYLQYTLRSTSYLRSLGTEDAYKFLTGVAGSEQTIDKLSTIPDTFDFLMPKRFERLNIHAEWNYPWGDLIKGGESGISPILEQVVTADGSCFWGQPDLYGSTLLTQTKQNLEMDPSTLWREPNEVKMIDFQPDVAKVITEKMKSFGIDRGVTSMTWIAHGSSSEGVTNNSGEVSVSFGDLPLDMDTYLKNQKAIDERCFHESLHALVRRSEMLTGVDRIKFRNLMLNIANQFSPLRSMKEIFSPDGTYPQMPDGATSVEIDQLLVENSSDMTITDYPFETLLGISYGKTVGTDMEEFCTAIKALGDEDVYEDLKFHAPNLDQYINFLSGNMEDFRGVSKLIAQTIVDNKDSILNMKRIVLIAGIDQTSTMIVGKVLPLTLVYLGLYKPQDLQKAMFEKIDPKLGSAYFDSWQKELKKFTNGQMYEELVGEVVGNMLSADEKGRQTIYKDAYNDFQKMLGILKGNGLAFQPAPNQQVI